LVSALFLVVVGARQRPVGEHCTEAPGRRLKHQLPDEFARGHPDLHDPEQEQHDRCCHECDQVCDHRIATTCNLPFTFSNPDRCASPTSRGSTNPRNAASLTRSSVAPSAHISMVIMIGMPKMIAPAKARDSAFRY